MKVNCNAKVNIGLDVVRRMENGYHELNMIMVPISLYDTLDISFASESSFRSNLPYIPTDERNSVIKVINRLRDIYHFDDQFAIHLEKRVPTQAGLGGGSSDAAMTIKVLNGILNLGMNEEEMIAFAKEIGADVPFFIKGKPAYVEGIGEKITPFSFNCPFYMLLVKPKAGVSTKRAFEELDFSSLEHPDISAIQNALMNNDYEALIQQLGNSLEQTALKIVPEIQKIKENMLANGFDGALMSGSGSTVIGFTRNPGVIRRTSSYYYRRYHFSNCVHIVEM